MGVREKESSSDKSMNLGLLHGSNRTVPPIAVIEAVRHQETSRDAQVCNAMLVAQVAAPDVRCNL